MMNPKFIRSCLFVHLLSAGLAVPSAFANEQMPVKAKKNKASAGTLEELKLQEGDETGNEVKSLKAEIMVSRAENAAIQQAERLLQKYKGTEMEPEIQFRLAELYMRKSKTDRFFDLHRQSDTVVTLAPRMVREASPRDSVRKAVEIYSIIQSRNADFPQLDLVIFNNAFANQTLGQDSSAEVLYQELINRFPRSPLIADAHLAIGEIAFTKAQFAQALEHFDAIKKYPGSRVYPYGLYKAAWTHYNMHEAEKGLRKLEEVVAYGKKMAAKNPQSRLELRKEALNDMTLFFEDVFPAKDAYGYFVDQAGKEEVGPILLRLASLYERHSRFADQRVALQTFIEKLPESPLLARVYVDLISAYDHLREKELAGARMLNMTSLCEAGSDWMKAQKQPTDCQETLKDTSLKLAKKWLRAWKKLPSDVTYADASEKAFRVYLDLSHKPEEKDELSESRYAYADLLFNRQKFREASGQYALVSRAGQKSQVTHDAAYGAVLSMEKAAGEKWSSEDEKSFTDLAAEYIQKHPKGQYRLDLEYKMALLAYEKNRYQEAAPMFLRLGHEFADKEKGQKAQDLYLDILNIQKDYRGVRNYSSELLKTSQLPERREKIRKLYEQAYFLEIQSLEEKGQYKEALAEYRNFSKQNPKSDLNEKALWNSMQLQFRMGDMLSGAQLAETFSTQYPLSAQAENALLKSAQTFEQMGQLTDAARVLIKLAGRDTASTKRWKELAADFYALDEQAEQARLLYQDLKKSGDAPYRSKILAKLEVLERNYGTEATRAEVRQAMIAQNLQPQSSLAQVEALEARMQKGGTVQVFNEARHLLGSSQMPKDLKARVRLMQARILEQEFLKQSVKSRSERVGLVLAMKTEKLQKAQEAFQDAIRYGNRKVSLEAFERLYGCYDHYVKALKDMPVPAGLSPQDARAFRSEISNLVVPLEEKSVDSLAQAVAFAKKNAFLDGSISRLANKLATLNQASSMDVAPVLQEPILVLPVLAGVNP